MIILFQKRFDLTAIPKEVKHLLTLFVTKETNVRILLFNFAKKGVCWNEKMNEFILKILQVRVFSSFKRNMVNLIPLWRIFKQSGPFLLAFSRLLGYSLEN